MKVDGRGGSRKCANVVPRVKGFAGGLQADAVAGAY